MARPLNIAHRGFTHTFPDNTLEAFEAAINLAVDGIECDVHETADRHFIIHHDADIQGTPIAELTLGQARALRVAGQYRIPTLEETLDLCHRRIKLNLEIKLVHSLDLFLQTVRAASSPEELILSSFHVVTIRDLADMAPEMTRGILTAYTVTDPLAFLEQARASIILPRYRFLEGTPVEALHTRRLSVIVWECNTRADIRTALARGVDGIITDNADIVAEELRKET